MKSPCKHGSILPRGLKCQAGYLIIRIFTDQGPFNKGCGPHTPAAEKVARLALDEIRLKQRLGSFNIPSRMERLKFKDAVKVFHRKHYIEWKAPKTNEPRAPGSISSAWSMLKNLTEYFGEFYLDAINVQSVEGYKRQRVEYDDANHATFNKEKGLLSSLINQFRRWTETGEIKPVKLPRDTAGMFLNPTALVEDLEEKARTRVVSLEELKRLKEACLRLNDPAMWTAIKAELDTQLRLSDFLRAIGNSEHTLVLRQGKTGKDVRLPGNPLLASLVGQFKSADNLQYRWSCVIKEADLLDTQWRDLRRTGAKLAEKLGATRSQVKNALGHANENTTEIYIPSDPDDLREISQQKRKVLESL